MTRTTSLNGERMSFSAPWTLDLFFTRCPSLIRVIISAEKKKKEEADKKKPQQRRGNKVIEDSDSDDGCRVTGITNKVPPVAGSSKNDETGASNKVKIDDPLPHAPPPASPLASPMIIISPPASSQKRGPKPSSAKKSALNQDREPDAPLREEGGTQTQIENEATGTQTQGGASSSQPKGDLTLILPDKLPSNKILVELHAASEHSRGTMDLAGDAGSVGRIVVNKGQANTSGAGSSFQIDLKGTLFDAQVLPLNGTAMIINIGVDQAKVEAVMHDFVRLKEDPSAYVFEDGVDFGYGSDDDDGHYAPGGVEGQAEGEGEEGSKKKKPKKAKAGQSSSVERKRPLSAKGTVKKKTSKAKTKSKVTKTKPKATKAKPTPKDKTTKRKGDAPKAPATKRKKKAESDEEDDFESEESEEENESSDDDEEDEE